MQATWNGHRATVVWEPGNGDRLLSPDGQQHLVPCSGNCGRATWEGHLVEAVTCPACWAAQDDDFPATCGACGNIAGLCTCGPVAGAGGK